MIELNTGQKIAGFIFAGLILLGSVMAIDNNSAIAAIIGFAIAAGLVIWCLYKKPK